MLTIIKDTPVIKQGDTFYSVYFGDSDPNFSSDIEIMEHESCFTLDQVDYEESTDNWFLTREDAEAAKAFVCGVLRLTINE